MKRLLISAWFGAGLGLAIPLAQPAAGAEAGAETAVPDAGGGLSEITVTARKRAENVQDVPIAITAFSSEQLQELQVRRVTDLVESVPNMVADGGGNILGAIGLRGIVSETRNLGFDSGLGVYVDGVLTVRPTTANQELPDIASIEVLRGPQGTLFGRNTTAGAINITTIRPSDTFTGDLHTELGNLGTRDVGGYFSGPLIDGKLSVIVSGYSNNRDGYIYNETLNTRVDDLHHDGARVGLLFTPFEDFEVRANAYYDSQNDNRLYGQLKENTNGFLAGQPGIFANPYLVQQDTPSYQDIESAGGNVQINWKLPNRFTLTSISAYGREASRFQDDDDARPINVASSNFIDSSEQLTQEIRLASPNEGPLDYLGGLYYFHQYSASNRSTLVNGEGFIGYITDNSALKTDAYAAFVSGNYRPVETVEITAGLRYSDETKAVDFRQRDTSFIGLPTLAAPLQNTYSDVTGNAGITYKIASNFRTYATFSKGFKSGGFNADVVGSTNIAFAPEYVTAYEVGLKSEPFAGRARANLAIFQSNISGLQVSQLVGDAFQIENAASSKIKGSELETIIQAYPGLDLHFSAGYTDARFRQFDACGAGLSCAGKYLPFVTKWTVSAGAEYQQRITDSSNVSYRFDWSHHSASYVEPTNNAEGLVPGFRVANARVAYTGSNGRYEFGLWSKNLFDQRYLENAFYLAPYQQWKVTWAVPRTFGMDARVHF